MQSFEIINAFEPHQAYVLRVLSVVASCLSIGAGLAAFYLYISMRVKVFRHHLILLLLMFDFGKALVLLWYPARVLLVPSAYDNINFCDVVGFFTSAFIEGADFAVLALAIHTALLIFKKSSGPEGGLYKFRYYVYAINILLPLLMASLAFVDNGRRSYAPMVTWCYLPPRPMWYRFVLSWGPRYIIIISIIAIYVSIYIYVKLEYSKVIKEFKQSQTYLEDNDQTFNLNTILSNQNEKLNQTSGNPSSGCFSKACRVLNKVYHIVIFALLRFFSYFPGFSFLEPSKLFASQGSNEVPDLDSRSLAIREFQKDTMSRFEQRRNMIERQIRSIFVYPVAYVFLWIAPFAVHVLQIKYEFDHGPVFWVGAIAAFMQPFNCVVDTIAFSIRERPWVDRKERIFTRRNADKIKYHFWRLLTCACVTRARPRNGSSNNNSSRSNNQHGKRFNSTASTGEIELTNNNMHTTKHDENYSSTMYKDFDIDLERFAKQQNSGIFSKPDFVDDSDCGFGPNRVNHRTPNPFSQQHKPPGRGLNKQATFDDHPFLSTTANKVEFDNDNASEGSMDLLEFLR